MRKYDSAFVAEVFEQNPKCVHLAVNRDALCIGTTTDWIGRACDRWSGSYESDRLTFGVVDISGVDWKSTKRTNRRALATLELARLKKCVAEQQLILKGLFLRIRKIEREYK